MSCSWLAQWDWPQLPGPAPPPRSTPHHGELPAIAAPCCFLSCHFQLTPAWVFLVSVNYNVVFLFTGKVNIKLIWQRSCRPSVKRDLPVGWKTSLSSRTVLSLNLHMCIKHANGSVQNSLSFHPRANTQAQLVPPYTFLLQCSLIYAEFFLNLCHPQNFELLRPKRHPGGRNNELFLTTRKQLELLTILIFDWSFGRPPRRAT